MDIRWIIGITIGVIGIIVTILVVPTNEPQAVITSLGGTEFNIGESIIFSAEGSSDPDGKIVKYEWDFGDGNESVGFKVEHVYQSKGDKEVRLRVTDNTNNDHSSILKITINETSNLEKPNPIQPIMIPNGASIKGCEETDVCYIPSSVNVGVGETVTWSNDDMTVHTVTSGTPDSTDGIFDSGLFAAGTIFSHTFEEEGTFDYFCMVHPWMGGSVTIKNHNET